MTRGSYIYRLNGEPAPVEESWEISNEAGAVQYWNSERIAGDTRISVAAEVENGKVRQCGIRWKSGAAVAIDATYRDTPDGLAWRRTQGEEIGSGVVSGEATILYPLMRVFTGLVIAQLAQRGGEGPVLVPDIGSSEVNRLLLPDLSQRRVALQGDDRLPDWPHCQRWQFIGGRYDNTAAFWLDSDNRLLRYQWQQSPGQLWEVELAP